MRIAVTGASGFLGKYVVAELIAAGHNVIAIGRHTPKLEMVYGDRSDIQLGETDYSIASLCESFKNVDVVIHLASKLLSRNTHPYKITEFFSDNISVFENIVLASLECKVKRVCQTSSISVYSGSCFSALKEDDKTVPSNIYGVSKLICEDYGNFISANTKLKITNLRIARLFGFGERSGLMFTDFITNALNGQPLTVHGRGASTIEYIYVKDAATAIASAIKEDVPHGTYNIGSGSLYSILEIAESVNKVFENDANLSFQENVPDNIRGTLMSSEKAEIDLNWRARWALEEALVDIREYYEKNKPIIL